MPSFQAVEATDRTSFPAWRGIGAALLALALLCAAAPGASGVVVRLADGTSLSYQPLRGAYAPSLVEAPFSGLEYGSGPVMASNTNYAFYWDPPGAPAYPGDYRAGVDRFFEDLAHDSGGRQNVDSVSTQYDDASGAFAEYDSHFGGALLDTKLGITKLRGQWKLYKGTTLVMPTYHPSYLIRPSAQQAEAKKQAWEDLQAVMKELKLPAPAKK